MVRESWINCPNIQFYYQKYHEDISHKIYSWAHWKSKDIHMLQGLNLSVQGCMNNMWIILLVVKEIVIVGIHTFLKSCADIKISVFSLLSFSAWDIAHEGKKQNCSLKRKHTQLKLKVYSKYKFLFKFKIIFFQLSEHKKRWWIHCIPWICKLKLQENGITF